MTKRRRESDLEINSDPSFNDDDVGKSTISSRKNIACNYADHSLEGVSAALQDASAYHQVNKTEHAGRKPGFIEATARPTRLSEFYHKSVTTAAVVGVGSSGTAASRSGQYDTLDRTQRRKIGFWTPNMESHFPQKVETNVRGRNPILHQYRYRFFASWPMIPLMEPELEPSSKFSLIVSLQMR
jgi:hypothetical protein